MVALKPVEYVDAQRTRPLALTTVRENAADCANLIKIVVLCGIIFA